MIVLPKEFEGISVDHVLLSNIEGKENPVRDRWSIFLMSEKSFKKKSKIEDLPEVLKIHEFLCPRTSQSFAVMMAVSWLNEQHVNYKNISIQNNL